MILWPPALALVIVWFVFKDPAIDYRVVIAGALLPDLVDGPFGGARVLHALMAAVAVLVTVMLATRGHRHARRRWLFLPVGMFLHLVADGMWTRTVVFWWPFFGASLSGPLPAIDHGPAVLVAEELAGALMLGWFWVRFRLDDPAVRANFVRAGRLPRGD
ncbi:MAG TPA: metal-dependent hydrolase [Acidimicrobiales bacterium]